MDERDVTERSAVSVEALRSDDQESAHNVLLSGAVRRPLE